MKEIAEVGDVIEYIFDDIPILATVGLVDMEREEYGVYVTSQYSFRCANIAQDYVKFSDVIAIFKKVSSNDNINHRKEWGYFPINPTNPLTDWRNLC